MSLREDVISPVDKPAALLGGEMPNQRFGHRNKRGRVELALIWEAGGKPLFHMDTRAEAGSFRSINGLDGGDGYGGG